MFFCFRTDPLYQYHFSIFVPILCIGTVLLIVISIVFITRHATVGPKAHHSSFDDDQLMKLCLLMILYLISDRFMIKILVGAKLQQRI